MRGAGSGNQACPGGLLGFATPPYDGCAVVTPVAALDNESCIGSADHALKFWSKNLGPDGKKVT
jgi:hypothetical protein